MMHINHFPRFPNLPDAHHRVASTPTPHFSPLMSHHTPRIHDAATLPRTVEPRAARFVVDVPVHEEEEIVLPVTPPPRLHLLHQRGHLIVEALASVEEHLVRLLVLIHEARPCCSSLSSSPTNGRRRAVSQQNHTVALRNEREEAQDLVLHIGSERVGGILTDRAVRQGNGNAASKSDNPQMGLDLVAVVVQIGCLIELCEDFGCLMRVGKGRVVITGNEEMGNAIGPHFYC